MGCTQSISNQFNEVSSKEPWKDWSAHPVHAKYKCSSKLGAGAFSQVHHASHVRTNEEAAIKIVFKERPGLKKKYIQVLRNEVAVLRALHHPNIIGLKGVLEDEHQIAIILERVHGPEMQKHLDKIGHYSEDRAGHIFYQLAQAVHHMHMEGYIHRDLKPENVLFVEAPSKNPEEKLTIKLIDMGMSVKFDPETSVSGALGTPGYLAPEARDMKPHTFAMDVWSLGVILFQMLRGKMPFSKVQIQKFQYTTIDVPRTGAFKARTGNQKEFSSHLEDLLTKMLQLQPQGRPSTKEILEHPWVAKYAPRGYLDNLQTGPTPAKGGKSQGVTDGIEATQTSHTGVFQSGLSFNNPRYVSARLNGSITGKVGVSGNSLQRMASSSVKVKPRNVVIEAVERTSEERNSPLSSPAHMRTAGGFYG
mmetsp:Transcript_16478/g.42239  ORF Transcript_16478/g.42239 Transcript_16478/m.42239 type:complete len:419 (+) Transcript_16478:262-1518(+)